MIRGMSAWRFASLLYATAAALIGIFLIVTHIGPHSFDMTELLLLLISILSVAIFGPRWCYDLLAKPREKST